MLNFFMHIFILFYFLFSLFNNCTSNLHVFYSLKIKKLNKTSKMYSLPNLKKNYPSSFKTSGVQTLIHKGMLWSISFSSKDINNKCKNKIRNSIFSMYVLSRELQIQPKEI